MHKKISIFFLLFLFSAPLLASNQFLWKGESESDHKLVVLLPNKYRMQNVKSIKVVSNKGSEFSDNVSQNGHNGDRIHARFFQHGDSYGRNRKVVVTFNNGNTRIWNIPDGKTRHESFSQGTGTGSVGSLDDVLTGGAQGVKKGDVHLNEDNQGTKEYTCEKDGVVKVTACLRTYGRAHLKVEILRMGGEKEVWLKWKRANDSEGSPLYVNGKADKKSMFEENPGDLSARAVTHKCKAQAGDKFILTLKGSFGGAGARLALKAP